MKYFLLITVLGLQSALASDVTRINQLINQISDEVNYEQHNQATLRRVKNSLKRSLNILQGGTTNPPARGLLLCISRDNDGRDPYILGMKDPRTLQTLRIINTNVGNKAQCKQVVQNYRQGGQFTIACVSKDNAGKDPWSPTLLGNGRMIKKLNSLGALPNCIASINNAVITNYAMGICLSRDNDGKSPFVKAVLSFSDLSVTYGEQFSKLAECLRTP